ncbi:hybrid sensor histidine kinase/response regulator [Novosphingobium mathurense]|uniref:histidine kinase n=1 Tax=Novosphingobium mathurense TaxID=428990 RepID=A0A1U6I4G1_9SPHN|nr:ATP-binding protein [Novosphingobium mathurense]SLK02867.1 Signal transduction histidine kinase [Novosphingobium mathurense]
MAQAVHDVDSRRLIGEVIDALPDGLAIFDDGARLVQANRRFRELNPLVAELVEPGLDWGLLLFEMAARGAISARSREALESMEMRLGDDERAQPPLELETRQGMIHALTMRQTATGGFVLTQSDITEARQREESDREADALLREVLEACPANLVMARIGDGQIIYRTPAARELLGSGRDFGAHFASRGQRADFITALLPEGRVDEMRVDALRPDGDPFPCLASARLIDYRGEDVVLYSMVDISKEAALRKTLSEQRERIFQAEKMSALGELLAGVAHELNNPLSVVVGHALMMREEASDPDTIRRIEKIGSAAERCTGIVKSFLAMARRQNLKVEAIDFATAIRDAIDTLEQGTGALTAKVELDVAPDLPPLQGDAGQIRQVFMNLVANADQAIRDGGGSRITVRAREEPGGASLTIDVIDDGPGISTDSAKRVFEPLFTTKAPGQGTGIGLAFCHRVVNAHGGTIALMPASKGAHFRITLPLAEPESESPHEVERPEPVAATGRVLVIDDEKDVSDLIREILRKEGFQVDSAASAERGLALARSGSYRLILTDLNMPGMGGRGLFETLSGERPEIAERVAFITGDTMSPEVRAFLDRANRPYLEKPVAPRDLRGLVTTMLKANHG